MSHVVLNSDVRTPRCWRAKCYITSKEQFKSPKSISKAL